MLNNPTQQNILVSVAFDNMLIQYVVLGQEDRLTISINVCIWRNGIVDIQCQGDKM